jgi:hypothetical protein
LGENQDVSTFKCGVCTVIGQIQVHVACETIFTASTGANIQLNVGSEFEILENSFRSYKVDGEMP